MRGQKQKFCIYYLSSTYGRFKHEIIHVLYFEEKIYAICSLQSKNTLISTCKKGFEIKHE